MADSEHQPPILDGRYRLVEELGRGSAATVYKARDFQLDRDVAIKLLTLLTVEGEPELADFGLAKSGSSQLRTASGLLMGTPAFMGPELFAGAPSGPATDLFAWGVLVYYLINGKVEWPPRAPTAPGEV